MVPYDIYPLQSETLTVLKFVTLLIDGTIALWVTFCAFFLLYWLPKRSYFFPNRPLSLALLTGSLARTLLGIPIGISLLVPIGIFNWLTLVLGYTGCLFAIWYSRVGNQIWKTLRSLYESCFFSLFDVLDQGLNWGQLGSAIASRLQRHCIEPLIVRRRPSTVYLFFGLIVILSFSLLVRYGHPLLELRFAQAEYYQTLLATRQIMVGDWPTPSFPLYASLAAVLSMISAIDPMQVLRFLGPLVSLLLVGVVGQMTWMLTWQRGAALAAAFSLGAYCFTWSLPPPTAAPDVVQTLVYPLISQINQGLVRQWSPGTPEIAALCLLLSWISLIPLKTRQYRRSASVNLLCSVALVALTAPDMLPLQLLGSFAILLHIRLGLALIGGSWLTLAGLAAFYPEFPCGQSFFLTLPVGLSLLIGGLFALMHDGIQSFRQRSAIETISLIVAFALTANFALPIDSASAYLEHDITARTAIQLNHRYSSKRWMVVAPFEQFVETSGDGWYEDLANFVEQYGRDIEKPGFTFPIHVPDLFVFVEKHPFQTFEVEPSIVSGMSAFDPVYRNYRLLAGRASLEFEALKLCEQYRKNHLDSDIYFEDEVLRVYHFKGLAEGAH
ncbi:hypothetical protein C7271_02085 [filamentous cyanobacterium CCP5]|nr:hypothetical protein C7271_02085 [filamentous cyanobacterium CCP5]